MTTTYQYQHKIAYYLNISYLEYEQLREHYFRLWCKAYTYARYGNYQAMVTNDDLRNWFVKRWETHVENELQHSYDDYMNEDVMTPDDLYNTIFILSKSILWIYPQVLIKEINRKLTQYEKRNVCK